MLQESGKKLVSAEDGRYLINNGLHAIKALQNASAELDKDDADVPDWLNEELAEIFSGGGVLVDLVEYSSPDRSARYAMQAMAHEQEQNRYRPTTLKNKVDLVARIYENLRDWSAVTKQLLDVLGASKRSTVQRWVTLARDLDADVLAEIQAKRPTLPQDFVVGNKFLTGRGESQRFRLSAKYASIAIEWFLDITGVDDGGVSASTFVNEICLPAKTLELWEQSTLKKFGAVAESFKPFQRVVQSLQRNGRSRILACIRERMPLGGGGKAGPGTSVGIEECKAVLDELSKMKAGSVAVVASTADGDDAAPAESQGSEAAAELSGAADGEHADLLTVGSDAGLADDPLSKQLQAEVAKQLVHVAIHNEKQTFVTDCKSRIVSEEKALIYVEAPSSKARILADFLKIASELPTATTAAVFVPVGSRLSLLSTAAAAVKKWFPGRQVFTVAIGADQQSARSRTSFGIYVPVPSVKRDVPSSLSSTGCRAKAVEGLRMRCKSAACRFRPARNGDTDLDFQEVFADDIPSDGEKDAADAFEEDADGDDADDVAEEARGSAADVKVLANLFPFAYPVSLHIVILGALRANSMSHVFLLTRSPHPGLQVAARESGLEVVVLMDGPWPAVRSGSSVSQRFREGGTQTTKPNEGKR